LWVRIEEGSMDGQRFDEWARAFAVPGTRRRLLGGLAAGALGLVGLGRAEAATCRDPGRLCREHANCCSGLCGPKDVTGRRTCHCQTPTDCRTPTGPCHAATCTLGVCGETILVGQACDDGNPLCCAGTCCAETCLNSVCTGTCAASGSCGDVPNVPACSPDIPTCACTTLAEGGGACTGPVGCLSATPCTATTDCLPGFVCSLNTCCGDVCTPICALSAGATAAAVFAESDICAEGPTSKGCR
jgi:hypothetical protein